MFLLDALHVAVPHFDLTTLTQLRLVNKESKSAAEKEGKWWYKAAKTLLEKGGFPATPRVKPSMPDAFYSELMQAYLSTYCVPLWKEYIEIFKFTRRMHREIRILRKKGASTRFVLKFSVNLIMDTIGYDHLETLAGKRRMHKLAKIMEKGGSKVVQDAGFHSTCWMVFGFIKKITK